MDDGGQMHDWQIVDGAFYGFESCCEGCLGSGGLRMLGGCFMK